MKPQTLTLILITALLVSFCKKKEDTSAPHLTTRSADKITFNTVRCVGGSITNGPIVEKGICWSDARIPDITDKKVSAGDGDSDYSVTVTGLLPDHSYYVRAYATNKYRTGYGEAVLITTKSTPTIPMIDTRPPGNITKISIVCGGQIISIGESEIDSIGLCWSTSPAPTKSDNIKVVQLSSGAVNFTTTLDNLSPNTSYYIRSFIATPYGTAYGDEVLAKTFYGVVIDQDGNVYNTVLIGNKQWLAENLKVTHFNDGTAIPNITSNSGWYAATQPAFCNYNASTNTPSIYGKLYNWHCVSGSKNIAPLGWHVATSTDWQSLVTAAGGGYLANDNVKISGTDYWYGTSGTNETGFSAVGCGYRDYGGAFNSEKYLSGLWVKGPSITYICISYTTYYMDMIQTAMPQYGYSIRCVKD